MKIFKDELDIAEQIRSQASVFACSQIKPSKSKLEDKNLEHLPAFASNLSLPDLYPIDAILVSTGLNLNYDFFDNKETFAAKDTPLNKPFDFEHKSSDILGHIVSVSLADMDGNILNANEVPDSFEIPFTGVLYRHFHDSKDKQERTDKIIAAIENPTEKDKWYVSMECRFNGFDYLIFNEKEGSSNAKLVERNDNTSFLTKHLRQYGGTGNYKNEAIARVLRNITFSGVGLVRNPGNPRSIILNPTNGRTSEKIYTISTSLGYDKNSEDIMNEKEFEQLKADNAKLKVELAEACKIVSETNKTNWEKQVAELNISLTKTKEQLDSEVASTKAAKSEVDVAKSSIEKLEKDIKDLNEQLDKFKTEATKAEADRKQLDRLNKVKDAYGVASVDEAKKFADPLTALTDEAFASHLEVIKNLKKGTVEQKVDANVLNNTEPKKDNDLVVPVDSTNDAGKALASELNDFFNIKEEEVDDTSASKKKTKKNKSK